MKRLSQITLNKFNYVSSDGGIVELWFFLETSIREISRYYNIFNSETLIGSKETLNYLKFETIAKKLSINIDKKYFRNIWFERCKLAHDIKKSDFKIHNFHVFNFVNSVIFEVFKHI